MIYNKTEGVNGAWVDKSKVVTGQRAKIVSETKPVPSTFLDTKGNIKNQDVCKVMFEGQKEAVNVSLGRANITALIDAFGEDSVAWMNHYLTVEVEKMRVAGKAVTALYLIPEGYKKIDDEEGYAKIVPASQTTTSTFTPEEQETLRRAREAEQGQREEISEDEIPF